MKGTCPRTLQVLADGKEWHLMDTYRSACKWEVATGQPRWD